MSLAHFGRYQRALDQFAGVLLTGMGLIVSASIAFMGV
jgi:hypothetical protein